MRIGIGADHDGFELKGQQTATLKAAGLGREQPELQQACLVGVQCQVEVGKLLLQVRQE